MPKSARSSVKKQATNVSIRSDLLAAARARGVNLSATLEMALAAELGELQRQRWLEANRSAIDAYNKLVDEHGTFSDGQRTF